MANSERLPDFNGAFVCLIDPATTVPSVAIKDIIDVAGYRTTAGCAVLARLSREATADASCLLGFRKAGLSIFGKTNLHELAFGTTGENDWAGTPINPLGVDIIPGGSSSGNAVALALGLCDIAIGTDTGGSVRIPSACCGTTGLKTTFGRVPTDGVRPLASSLDVVGPMARDIAGLDRAMSLLDPDFRPGESASLVNRLVFRGVDARVESAIDSALAAADLNVVTCPILESEWEEAIIAANDILWAEAAQSNLDLLIHWDQLQTGTTLKAGLAISRDVGRMRRAAEVRERWTTRLHTVIGEAGVLVTPTLQCLPPSLAEVSRQHIRLSRFTSPVNLAGLPAVVLPIPSQARLPASIQLVGPAHCESRLLATGRRIENAVTA